MGSQLKLPQLEFGIRTVRLAFAGVFALAALICARIGLGMMSHELPPLFSAAPLAIALVFAVAAWSGFRSRPHIRAWSLAASGLMILGCLFALTYMRPPHLTAPLWFGAALGYAGLAAFARRHPGATTSQDTRAIAALTHATLPGDGTSAISSKVAALVAAVAAVEGTSHWSNWAAAHGLPLHNSPILLVKYLLAAMLVLLVHEGGHAIAGLLLRMKVVTFIAGPFRWWKEEGRWRFEFRPLDIVSFLGAVGVVPMEMENFRMRKLAQVAAGPIASLVTGLLAVPAILHAPGHAWATEWRVLAYFATISLVVALLNVIPFKLGSGYSDGAKFYQLSHTGLWADYHRLVAAIHATQVTAMRPRDFDIATVERAAGTIARGTDELNMHLCAYAHYLDSGQLGPARDALLKAEALCDNASLEPPDHWYSEFVFAIAFLRRDSAAARRWWDRMQSRESLHTRQPRPHARLASRSALLLSEGRIAEAAEVWKKADAWSRRLPNAGAADAQRHRIQLLGHAVREHLAAATA